jgi:type II restriction enzyme
MVKLKISDLVASIVKLGTQKSFVYPAGYTKVRIIDAREPEGPITFVRWDSRKSEAEAKRGSISSNQLATVAHVFSGRPNYPIHFDRLFSAGGNSRSALEALLAYTPHFFICYPQRMHLYTGKVEQNLKHIMWCPNDEHTVGEIKVKECEQVISEVELGIEFGDIRIVSGKLGEELNIEAKKTHTQMQVALVEIGNALNFRTWIARNDRSIPVGGSQLGKLKGVLQSLDEVHFFNKTEIQRAASLIDCIWFSDDFKHVPAVIEVEHSTGVTSGLTRMLKLMNTAPFVTTNFTIVAPDELRNKVVSEANNETFRPLRARFMPYSIVRVLYGLIEQYSLSNLQRNFIEPFMETVVEE